MLMSIDCKTTSIMTEMIQLLCFVTGDSNECELAGLEANRIFYVRVAAETSVGVGRLSDEQAIQTSSTSPNIIYTTPSRKTLIPHTSSSFH